MVMNLPANAGDERDVGSIPGLGRSPGGGNGNPLQCSCLEDSMDRGTWRATVHGVTKSQTRLSTCKSSPLKLVTASCSSPFEHLDGTWYRGGSSVN